VILFNKTEQNHGHFLVSSFFVIGRGILLWYFAQGEPERISIPPKADNLSVFPNRETTL